MTTENRLYNEHAKTYTNSCWGPDTININDTGSSWYGDDKAECKPENQSVRNSDGSIKQNVSLLDGSQTVPNVSQLVRAELPGHTHGNVSSFEGIRDTTLTDQKHGLSWGWTRTWDTDKSYTTGFNINDVGSNLDISVTGNTTNWYTTVNNPQAFNNTVTICGVEVTQELFHELLYQTIDMDHICKVILTKVQELSTYYDYEVSHVNGFKTKSLTHEIEETLLSMIQKEIEHTHVRGTELTELAGSTDSMDHEDPFA